MMTAEELFNSAVKWLKENYRNHTFYLERDIVWTLQNKLLDIIKANKLPFDVFNDITIYRWTDNSNKKRKIAPDLIIICKDKVQRTQRNLIKGLELPAELVLELKYQPSYKRKEIDIPRTKFPAVFWSNGSSSTIIGDIKRISKCIQCGKTNIAYAMFIDEGGGSPFNGKIDGLTNISRWEHWDQDNEGLSVLKTILYRNGQA